MWCGGSRRWGVGYSGDVVAYVGKRGSARGVDFVGSSYVFDGFRVEAVVKDFVDGGVGG